MSTNVCVCVTRISYCLPACFYLNTSTLGGNSDLLWMTLRRDTIHTYMHTYLYVGESVGASVEVPVGVHVVLFLGVSQECLCVRECVHEN